MVGKKFSLKQAMVLLLTFTFSLGTVGCSPSGSSAGFTIQGYDLKAVEASEKPEVLTYSTISSVTRHFSVAGHSTVSSALTAGSSTAGTTTIVKSSTTTGVTKSSVSKTRGTGDETSVTTDNKNGQAAATAALKGNKQFSKASEKRQQIVRYALKWVGNPYKYGGTSLTHGADCSGFTQSVMKHFGIKLNRSSTDQRKNGKSTSKPEPGDLICYYGHVALYIGDGKIVHASQSKPYPVGGIKVSQSYRYRSIASIRNVVGD